MKSVPVDQNLFATFVAQRNNSLINRICDVDRKSSAEHIRRLRVGIKRWRTILVVVTDLILPRLKSEKAERSILRLFKWAGTIRD